MIIIQYIISFIILFAGIIAYFKLADKYNIIDKPNERSSHNYITIRGGGIVFWLAGLVYSVCNFPESVYFFFGLTLICGVSFWDDISSLPNRVRIIVHFLSITLCFYGLGLFSLIPWWLIIAAYILFTGILNAYNFMDGINGITGLYSLAILISLQYVNYKHINFVDPDFINYAGLACIVFLIFNFRKKAKCFAGDIGSMGVSFWIVTLLIQLMIKTDSYVWFLFLTVYGVDSVCTILHRLYLKQNIFKAHRLHFYQILSNHCGISHLKISVGYAFLQLIINALLIYSFIYFKEWDWIVNSIIISSLVLIYITKLKMMKKLSVL